MSDGVHIGTCSWKYESWRGLVYSDTPQNRLQEYARHYDTVEVDQWYWSLYGPQKVVLPNPKVAQEYAAAVPNTFRFAVKLPNALTMTHFRQAQKTDALVPNPHFLSVDVLRAFLERMEPMRAKLGPLMLQFGYLNKKMMASQQEFLDRLRSFVTELPRGYTWCIESRNPNYLSDGYFAFLREHGLGHVWLQGYYMPSIFGIYEKHADKLTDTVVIRLHGPDREGMEARSGQDWSKIIEPRDADLDALATMLRDLKARRRNVWLMVNNHFEGSAPLTIERIREQVT